MLQAGNQARGRSREEDIKPSNHRNDSGFMLHKIGKFARVLFRKAKLSSIVVIHKKECRGRKSEKERGLGQDRKIYIEEKGLSPQPGRVVEFPIQQAKGEEIQSSPTCKPWYSIQKGVDFRLRESFFKLLQLLVLLLLLGVVILNMWMSVCHGTHVVVRGHPEIGSLLPPHEPKRLNS